MQLLSCYQVFLIKKPWDEIRLIKSKLGDDIHIVHKSDLEISDEDGEVLEKLTGVINHLVAAYLRT